MHFLPFLIENIKKKSAKPLQPRLKYPKSLTCIADRKKWQNPQKTEKKIFQRQKLVSRRLKVTKVTVKGRGLPKNHGPGTGRACASGPKRKSSGGVGTAWVCLTARILRWISRKIVGTPPLQFYSLPRYQVFLRNFPADVIAKFRCLFVTIPLLWQLTGRLVWRCEVFICVGVYVSRFLHLCTYYMRIKSCKMATLTLGDRFWWLL